MGMTDEEAMLHDTLSELKRQLRSNDSAKIVLIGDVMMDCYIHGYANNLNSRAPVPVLRETSREEDVGAAAHVARGLRSMGLSSHLFGVVGDDTAGLSIIESLEAEGVTTHGIAIVEDRTTTQPPSNPECDHTDLSSLSESSRSASAAGESRSCSSGPCWTQGFNSSC